MAVADLRRELSRRMYVRSRVARTGAVRLAYLAYSRALLRWDDPSSPEAAASLRRRLEELFDEDFRDAESGLYPRHLIETLPARVCAGGAAAAGRPAADAGAHGARRLPRDPGPRRGGALPALLRPQLPLPERRVPGSHQRGLVRPPGRAALRRHRRRHAPPGHSSGGARREGPDRVGRA